MYQDLVGRIVILPLFVPAVRTVTTNSVSVDVRPFVDNFAVVLHSAGGTGALDVRAQHSVDDVTYIDTPGGVFTQVTITASLQIIRINARAVRGFLRLIATIGAATAPSFAFSAVVIGQNARI